MPNIWLTADPHFGHRLVAELRGFDSIEAHDDAIIAGWQAVVRPGDQVWVLGDVVVSASSLDHGLAILRDLPGVKDLVAGNHDACHPMHRRAHLAQGRYLEVFRSVQAFARRRLAGRDVLLSHFPYAGDHTNAERYSTGCAMKGYRCSTGTPTRPRGSAVERFTSDWTPGDFDPSHWGRSNR